MKKIFAIFLLVAVCSYANSQSHTVTNSISVPIAPMVQSPSEVIDTIILPNLADTACNQHLVYYSAGSSGYPFGNNSIGITENAQRFTVSGSSVLVSGALAFIYTLTPTHTTNTYLKLYNASLSTGGPSGSALATSVAVPLNQIGGNSFTYYGFTSPVAVANKFLVSFEVPTGSGDTAMVITTNMSVAACAVNDTAAWQLWAGTWYSVREQWNVGGQPLLINMAIYPIVDLTVGINEAPYFEGIRMEQNIPNPSVDQTSVVYDILEAAIVSLEIMDINGRVVQHLDQGLQPAGRHTIELSTKNLSPGTYFFSIVADGKRMTRKMLVE